MDNSVFKLLSAIVKAILLCVLFSTCSTVFLMLSYYLNSRILFIIASGFSFATPAMVIITLFLCIRRIYKS